MKDSIKAIKKNKGLTLIGLVVTIIVLLILVAVTIVILTGENGIITKTREAKEITEKAEIDEKLKLVQLNTKIMSESKDEKLTTDEYLKELEDIGLEYKLGNASEYGDIYEKVIIVNEKYVYGLSKNANGEIIYKEEGMVENPEVGTTNIPELTEETILISYRVNGMTISKDQWTQGPITIEVSIKNINMTEYTLETSQDAKTWKSIETSNITSTQNVAQIASESSNQTASQTSRQTFTKNGILYARLKNISNGQTGKIYERKITNIDTKDPNKFTPTIIETSITTNSITIQGSTTDAKEDNGYAGSGIEKYYYSKDNGATWEPTNGTKETSYTFSNLIQHTTYNLKMKAVDKVGKEAITDTITQETKSVPSLINKDTDIKKGNMTFTYSTTKPTNEKVTVTISTDLEDYNMQYTKENPTVESNWIDYIEGTEISFEENGYIYARLKDSMGQVGSYATGNIENIDKTAPIISTEIPLTVIEHTTDSITIKIKATDEDSKLGKIKWFYKKSTDSEYTSIEDIYETMNETTVEPTKILTDLVSGADYSIYAEVYDTAGNKTTSNTIVQKTEIMIETYSNKSDTQFEQNVLGMNSTNTAININATDSDNAGFKYLYRGLKPRAFYSVSAYVKVNSINLPNSDGEYGVNIMRYGTPASSETIKEVTTTWKKITLVAMSSTNGELDICFRLNGGSGNVLFDNIEIREIETDSDFKLYTYTNDEQKIGRIVFYNNNVNGTGITNSEIENWLKALLKIRANLTELTGKEFDNGNVDIIATNYYNPAYAYAIAGRTEIQWMRNCVDLASVHTDFRKGADTPFFITHEMGHQHTSNQSNFDGEYWATALGLMASYNLDLKISGLKINGENTIRQGQTIIDYGYNSYCNNFPNSKFSGDGLIYITFQTILTLNSYQPNLGWESLEKTFHYLKDSDSLSRNGEKFEIFIIKWSEFSGYDVKSLFYSNGDNDQNIIENNFKIGKFDYVTNSDNNTITVKNYTRGWNEMEQDTYELTIPSMIDECTVTEIGSWCFSSNSNIKKLILPNTLVVLNDTCFYHCENLEEVVIPSDSQLTTIGSWVFMYNKLNEIFIPNTVTTIKEPALNMYNKITLIKGYSDTEAEVFANNHNLQFKALD